MNATAIVTGGCGGIGAATASRLAADGFTVYSTDLAGAIEAATEAVLATAHHRLVHDVADEDSWADVVGHVLSIEGRVDVLVNNAGVGNMATAVDEMVAGWHRVIGITQMGVWLGMRAVGPIMVEQRAGSIVNVASIFGSSGGKGDMFAYHAAKGAVLSMTKSAAVLWGPDQVRVNTVQPGFVQTPSLERNADAARVEWMTTNAPLGRVATAAEVANAIAFLAGRESGFITGADLVVDGGWLAR
ncbi:SDR family NAD(P)-dependent oxidoreductase [Modestobacter versicolor]|uniref:SDR family NAD(P)-dependent oxidoreductase n=1 Tax=Modestobacter versicolor TaxID=429133 RepID=UPI0034DE47EE